MVSVCMATHNGESYIREQLDSILSQLNADDEVIISDDGSTDRSLEIIKSFNDPRIKVYNFSQPENHMKGQQQGLLYASRNFENALKMAQGDIIFLSDQDDIWYPNKVNVVKDYLKDHDIIKHDLSLIDKNGILLKERHYSAKDQSNRSLYYLVRNLPFRGCCIAFRRSILDASFPFPHRCLQHDSWIGMIAAINSYRFAYIDTPLIYHRIHNNNASQLSVKNSLWYRSKYRIRLISQLIIHQFKSSCG